MSLLLPIIRFQIELDLLRTLPNNKHYDTPHADGVAKLRRVLLAYSVHSPEVEYCQVRSDHLGNRNNAWAFPDRIKLSCQMICNSNVGPPEPISTKSPIYAPLIDISFNIPRTRLSHISFHSRVSIVSWR